MKQIIDLNPQLELLLQTVGFTDREEREGIIKQINSEITVNLLRKFSGRYSAEQLGKKLASNTDTELTGALSEITETVLRDFISNVFENSSPEEKQRLSKLSEMIAGNTVSLHNL